MANLIKAITTGTGGLSTTADSSGAITFQKDSTTLATLDASGNMASTGTMTATNFIGSGAGLTGLAGGFSNMTVLTAPGTFTTPATTTQIKVTVVGGGGGIPGGTGGTSSFSTLASATGGSTGSPTSAGGAGGAGSAGTLQFTGGGGGTGTAPTGGNGGNSFLGGGGINGSAGGLYGGGTGGVANIGGGGGGGAAIYVGPVTASTPYPVTVGAGGPGNVPSRFGGAGVVVIEY
jgi:hypothetical protein